ncbi:unnamed protein product [Arctogadus glacialis]
MPQHLHPSIKDPEKEDHVSAEDHGGGAICSVKEHLCASHGEAETGASLTTQNNGYKQQHAPPYVPVLHHNIIYYHHIMIQQIQMQQELQDMELTPETAKQDRAEVARRGIPLTRRGAGEYIFLGAAWRQHDATEPCC